MPNQNTGARADAGACDYLGADTRALVTTDAEGVWSSRCNCLTVTCAAGTYEEANAALVRHREHHVE